MGITLTTKGIAMPKLCALDIGHQKVSPGCQNKARGLTEFDFNERVAKRVKGLVKKAGVTLVYRETYGALPAQINALNQDFAISLHCNAFDGTASGSETLYYHGYDGSLRLAAIVQKHIVGCLGLKDRGLRPKSEEERGGFQLKNVKAPCVIVEPFFLDNDADLAVAESRFDSLCQAYADAIDEYSFTLI